MSKKIKTTRTTKTIKSVKRSKSTMRINKVTVKVYQAAAFKPRPKKVPKPKVVLTEAEKAAKKAAKKERRQAYDLQRLEEKTLKIINKTERAYGTEQWTMEDLKNRMNLQARLNKTSYKDAVRSFGKQKATEYVERIQAKEQFLTRLKASNPDMYNAYTIDMFNNKTTRQMVEEFGASQELKDKYHDIKNMLMANSEFKSKYGKNAESIASALAANQISQFYFGSDPIDEFTAVDRVQQQKQLAREWYKQNGR